MYLSSHKLFELLEKNKITRDQLNKIFSLKKEEIIFLEDKKIEFLNKLCSKEFTNDEFEEISKILKISKEDFTNKYIWYIKDEDILNLLTDVKKKYKNNSEINEKIFFNQRIDPVKMMIDVAFNNISTEQWIKNEINRQNDKTNTNLIGFLQENLIGNILGWKSLAVGNGIDIESENKKIKIELKNKHNTCKGEDEIGIFQKLESFLDDKPQNESYYARIISTNSENKKWLGERIDKNKNIIKFDNDNIYIISGDKLYELLTNDETAFKKMIYAIPKVLKFINSKSKFNESNELEQYLINKNFSLSNYLGFESPKSTLKDILNPKIFLDIQSKEIIPLKDYKSIDLFSGAGGLALGLEGAGFNTIFLNEFDKDATTTLIANRPKWNVVKEDICNVVEKGIRNYIPENLNIDLISGGHPCQAFSYAGGLKDTRKTLFYPFAKAIEELQPKMFLAESVKGLISHNGGKTLKTMLDIYEELGYYVQYEVLNALNYGVAQKREVLIIVGIRKDLKEQYNLEYHFPKSFGYTYTLKDILKDVPVSDFPSYSENKKKVLELVPPGGCWRNLPDEIAKEYMGKSYYLGGEKAGMARRLSWDEPGLVVLCSPSQKQTERCHPDETRPFSIRENARIQSFPDDWEFKGSITAQYKQIGNAVPVKLAEAIGKSIIDVLNKIK